ncbi:MAG: phage head morphogenesis protein, partial [FCB group bacterium]|nr:phage head morphogenesis protein [FCB group bacterium]
IPVDVDDIEDQNILFFTESIQGQTRTVAQMKIRPEAERKLLAGLKKDAQWSKDVGRIGVPLKEDIFYNDILAAVKSINHHSGLGDYKFNNDTVAQVLTSYRAKLKILAASGDKDISFMVKSYIKTLDEIAESIKTGGKIKIGEFKQYIRRYDDGLSKTPMKSNLQVDINNRLSLDKKTVRQGRIVVDEENVSMSKMCCDFKNTGLEYRIDFGDGVTGIYRPWEGSNYYAQQGTLELRIIDRCTVQTVENLLGSLERLGINASLATVEDAEIMYLSKMAYILKEDESPKWKGLLKKLETGHASQSERVQVLRDYWASQLGVKDITKIPGYDPEGRFSIMYSTWKQGKQAGYRLQERFDITNEMLDSRMKDYYLYHSVTHEKNMPDLIDNILANNGAMVSTVEKMRIGVPVGGMSPTDDMRSGGASYFFTRIRRVSPGRSADIGLYFKKNLLRRMDAISYKKDMFGKVIGDTVRENRKSIINDWRVIALDKSTDETIFKNNVILLDNIDMIVVGSVRSRKAIVEAFKKHGITNLPDGRLVSSIVRTK